MLACEVFFSVTVVGGTRWADGIYLRIWSDCKDWVVMQTQCSEVWVELDPGDGRMGMNGFQLVLVAERSTTLIRHRVANTRCSGRHTRAQPR